MSFPLYITSSPIIKQEARSLNARVAVLEAEKVDSRWTSPIRVKFPPQQHPDPLTLSPESSLDLNAEGTELVDIMFERRDQTPPSAGQ
jgi:hypothetical protein